MKVIYQMNTVHNITDIICSLQQFLANPQIHLFQTSLQGILLEIRQYPKNHKVYK